MADDLGFKFTFQFVDATQCLALGSILPAVCIVVVVLRLLAKKAQKRGIGVDDWLIVIGLMNVVGMSALVVAGAAMHALGYISTNAPSDWTLEQQLSFISEDSVIVYKVLYFFQFMMILSYGSIKAGIVLFYRRLFVADKGTINDIVTKIALVIIGLWTVAFTFLMVFNCGTHFSANWGNFIEQYTYCQPQQFPSQYALAISDLVLDTIVILMPLPLVWKLRLSFGRRLSITGALLLGASAVGASVARLVLFIQILAASTNNVTIDANLETTVAIYWSLLEAGLALIAACLPIIWVSEPSKQFRAATLKALTSPRRWSWSSLQSSLKKASYDPEIQKGFAPAIYKTWSDYEDEKDSSSKKLHRLTLQIDQTTFLQQVLDGLDKRRQRVSSIWYTKPEWA